MRRFFYDPAHETADCVLISGAEAHHLRAVLRMRLGETAELFDGAGRVLSGQIEQINPESVTFRILARRQELASRSPLTLALALLKGKKMDLVIQKATELGVHHVVPVISRYCEPQGKDRQMLDRWQRIMLEACKQCGRPVPMQMSLPLPLQDVAWPAESSKLMPWENETACSFAALGVEIGKPVVVLIGPEGGFHPTEVEHARSCGFRTVSLGPRTLRAETAALTAVVLTQQAVGNLEP
jgi:16S rRNA (uracil1498-N3)-methyltransferase